jgi:acyl-CoA synthetase (AMP-forming)/AMP-acid ligase II
VICVGLCDGTTATLASPPVDARLTSTVPFSYALAQGSALAFTPVASRADDLLFLQYTGGTTGLSKGAALSHKNLVANTEQLKAFIPDALRAGEEVVVTALPLYHIFALMVNFYPNEVEAVAAACAGIAECVCVGRTDEKTGDAVRLFVAKVPGATLTEDDMIAHCRRELAAYKVPKEVRFLDTLPKSNVGKILRKDLRAIP